MENAVVKPPSREMRTIYALIHQGVPGADCPELKTTSGAKASLHRLDFALDRPHADTQDASDGLVFLTSSEQPQDLNFVVFEQRARFEFAVANLKRRIPNLCKGAIEKIG